MKKIDLPEVDGLSADQVLTLVSCRNYDQYRSMLASYRDGTCPFCDPLDEVLNPVIHQNTLWRMWVNPFPMAHTKLHLILASKRHVGPHDDVSVEDFSAMGELFCWAKERYAFMGGGFVMRFGSPFESCCSVFHRHANIIVPDGTGDASVRLAKSPSKIREQVARFRVYQKLDAGIPRGELSAEEQVLLQPRG